MFSAKKRRKLRRILLCYSHLVLFDFAQPARGLKDFTDCSKNW